MISKYQLVMRSGPTPGKIYDLDQDALTIGRDSGNIIVINDPEISRRHTRLVLQSGGYLIEDMGSTNGTFVNSQRLMGPHLLKHGETINLGDNVVLGFEQMQFDPDATMLSPASSMPASPAPAVYQPSAAQQPPAPQPVYQQPAPQPVYPTPAGLSSPSLFTSSLSTAPRRRKRLKRIKPRTSSPLNPKRKRRKSRAPGWYSASAAW